MDDVWDDRCHLDPTPGPWSVGVDGIAGGFFIPEVPAIATPHGIGVARESDAVAIAAVPDLLRACRVALGLDVVTNCFGKNAAVREILAEALRKAEGRC